MTGVNTTLFTTIRLVSKLITLTKYFIISRDKIAATHNYGPGSTSSSSNNWPEQFNNGYQRSAPPPQYDSCMEMGGHPPGQNITQFGTPTNHGVFYNNTFPIMTPTNLRDGVASSPPGRCPFNVNPEGTPPMAKITAQRSMHNSGLLQVRGLMI